MLTRALILYGDQNPCLFRLDCCVPRKDKSPLRTPDWQLLGQHGLRIYPVNIREAFDATSKRTISIEEVIRKRAKQFKR